MPEYVAVGFPCWYLVFEYGGFNDGGDDVGKVVAGRAEALGAGGRVGSILAGFDGGEVGCYVCVGDDSNLMGHVDGGV